MLGYAWILVAECSEVQLYLKAYRVGSNLVKLVWNMGYCTPQMMIEAKLLVPNPNEESFSTPVESEFLFNCNFNYWSYKVTKIEIKHSILSWSWSWTQNLTT